VRSNRINGDLARDVWQQGILFFYSYVNNGPLSLEGWPLTAFFKHMSTYKLTYKNLLAPSGLSYAIKWGRSPKEAQEHVESKLKRKIQVIKAEVIWIWALALLQKQQILLNVG